MSDTIWAALIVGFCTITAALVSAWALRKQDTQPRTKSSNSAVLDVRSTNGTARRRRIVVVILVSFVCLTFCTLPLAMLGYSSRRLNAALDMNYVKRHHIEEKIGKVQGEGLLGPTTECLKKELERLKEQRNALQQEELLLQDHRRKIQESANVFNINLSRDGFLATVAKLLFLIGGLYGGLLPIMLVGRLVAGALARKFKPPVVSTDPNKD